MPAVLCSRTCNVSLPALLGMNRTSSGFRNGAGTLPAMILSRLMSISFGESLEPPARKIRASLPFALGVTPSARAMACNTEMFSFVFSRNPPGLRTWPTTYTIPARATLTRSPGYTSTLERGLLESSRSFRLIVMLSDPADSAVARPDGPCAGVAISAGWSVLNVELVLNKLARAGSAISPGCRINGQALRHGQNLDQRFGRANLIDSRLFHGSKDRNRMASHLLYKDAYLRILHIRVTKTLLEIELQLSGRQ